MPWEPSSLRNINKVEAFRKSADTVWKREHINHSVLWLSYILLCYLSLESESNLLSLLTAGKDPSLFDLWVLLLYKWFTQHAKLSQHKKNPRSIFCWRMLRHLSPDLCFSSVSSSHNGIRHIITSVLIRRRANGPVMYGYHPGTRTHPKVLFWLHLVQLLLGFIYQLKT